MYKAFFEYQESNSSYLYNNFIRNILDNQAELHTQNISIENSGTDFKKIVIMLDILEDFTYELKSNFQSYKEAISDVSSIAGQITNFFDKLSTASALGQVTSLGADLMKVQVWKETEPFKMNFKFSLQTKTNPFIDVYLPATLLCSQTILSPISSEVDYAQTVAFRTPGVNKNKLNKTEQTSQTRTATITTDKKGKKTTTYSQTSNQIPAKQRNLSSKILDTFGILVRNIDNAQQQTSNLESNYSVSDTEYRSNESVLSDYNALVNIDYAFIETAKPTWSKERTTSGIPLWCELELTVQSVFSANDSMMGYIYPELTPTNGFFSEENASFIGRSIGRAARSKLVNIFR
jgi:hypothetical protein